MINFIKNKWVYSITFLIFAFIINMIASSYLFNLSQKQEIPLMYDSLLNLLPYYNVGYLFDIFALLTFFIFMIYLIKYKRYDLIPHYLVTLSFLIILRSLFIVLTPMQSPCDYEGSMIFNGKLFNRGMYPSGHTANTFLLFLFSEGIYKYLILFLNLLIIFCLLIAKGHYSIDIFSGVIFAYSIYSLTKNVITIK